MAQRHLHEHDRLLPLDGRFLDELRARPGQDVESEIGARPEAAPLDEDGLLVEHLRRLHDLARGREHGRFRQLLLDELQAHQPVVDVRRTPVPRT